MGALTALARNCIVTALLGCALFAPSIAAEEAADVATGTRLAELLRAARNVLSNYQSLINDPAIGDKKLNGERFTTEAIALYGERTGHPLISDDLGDRDRKLLQAQVEAMREV
ncbi:histidine kinase, partial [Sinorhizobium medicae]